MAIGTFSARTLLPPAILPVAVFLLLLFGLGQNDLLAILAVAVLLIGSALLWRPGESPILLFVFVYQWLQASARIFHANANDVDVVDLSYAGGQVALATILSLLALVLLAAGMRAGAGSWRAQDGELCRRMALSHDIPIWFRLYVLAWAGGIAALTLARFVPALSQPLLAVAALKWAFFWMLVYATFLGSNVEKKYSLIAFGLEFVTGTGGYFADFSTVFFMTILALAAASSRISRAKLLVLSALIALTLIVGLVWTAVKVDYRAFVSGGQAAQIVIVDSGARTARLAELVMELDADDLSEAVDPMVHRISYVDFFAVVLDTVPASVPHGNGALWWDAISRPFMPRFLFPEKTVIHDSERTNLYTRLGVSSFDAGTSISIGYIGESYIDFGKIGMMAAIFLYGLFLGRCYHWFLRCPRSVEMLGMALITSVLVRAAPIESSITKVIGGVVVGLLVAWFLGRYVVPALFSWLRARTRPERTCTSSMSSPPYPGRMVPRRMRSSGIADKLADDRQSRNRRSIQTEDPMRSSIARKPGDP